MMNYRGRRASSEYLELHVLCVPLELWNSKLNTISSEVIDNFISAGLIRVYPDITLKALRDELAVLLGGDAFIDRYSFLKCVGRSLALVKTKQERELKVKAFSPPYATHPELYLLPSYMDTSGSTRSHSHSSEMQSYSSNPHTSFRSEPLSTAAGSKEPVRFPEIKQVSNQPPTTSRDGGGGGDDDSSLTSTEEKEEDAYSSYNSGWGEDHSQNENTHEQFQTKKGQEISNNLRSARTVGSATKKHSTDRIQTKDSGVPDSVEDVDSGLSLSQDRNRYNKNNRTKCKKESSPTGAASYIHTARKPAATVFSTDRKELIEEIRLVKEERKQLERTRQELLRKGKDLLALNRHRRNQARDGWKRKYFDTKKATAPLEESLRSVRQELETFYTKLLQQLQAREGRNKHKRLGKASSIKNDLIIQIMTESYEIDDLRRKVDDCKMKLETEQKLRVQAATELRTLKAELASKKSQPSVNKPPVDTRGGGQKYPKPPVLQKHT
ncbi:spermatogenesis-associated protein 1 isoform X2 [Clupea harengus]|uniref:Spermatogenesis-associated protein 1 isoform X2 n=1 Tax=Clupea harengus TaxID=7950 RepID=A0A8M1KER7_CLUHA|nr:spermatogenesis-associated protein 1 isoform X2 [Clupea harengus]